MLVSLSHTHRGKKAILSLPWLVVSLDGCLDRHMSLSGWGTYRHTEGKAGGIEHTSCVGSERVRGCTDHLTKMGVLQLHNPTLPATLLHRANHMRLSGTLCDVIITVDGQEFPAHRTVLACTSKMFEILFHRSSLRYALDFLSPKTFQQILEYAYTASLQATAEDLDDLLYAAEILEIEYLEEQCLKVLETIQSEEKQDHLSLSGRNHGSESEHGRARHWRNMLISKKHSMQEGGINPTALHHLALYHMTDRSPSMPGGLPMGLPHPSLPLTKRIKTEDNNMQVDEVNSYEGRSSSGGEGGFESDQPRDEGPGTPQRGSVITSAREQHSGQEEGGIVGNNSPLDTMSLDLRAYGGLLPQGLLHREILSRLGQFAAGMRREGQSQSQSCGDCGLQLHNREAMEQHRRSVRDRERDLEWRWLGSVFDKGMCRRLRLSAVHRTPTEALVCDQCGATFSAEDALEAHRQTHTVIGLAAYLVQGTGWHYTLIFSKNKQDNKKGLCFPVSL
ncbi:unnamed protein product [Oncorhynchus mykiss]|uniref:BTB domain-containing protein n=1 Tax=Oncorhynchus mykiss TaxID=8022 RepID=A0A060XCI6_ONCMY|nr:unnamed protein product [Oncorhynchus mykiss]